MMTWEELEATCKQCRRCELCQTRHNVVFGCGARNATLMMIGEAPGEQEDLSGIPFVGAAGKLLDRYLFAVDIPRESVYIANMLKCRPPRNRDPLPTEQDLCIDYLREQVRLIRPKMIVCLGRISAMRLIRSDYKITREHGQWICRNGVWITAVYHPSLLLRDPRRKEEMLIDMKAVKAKLDSLCAENTAGDAEAAN